MPAPIILQRNNIPERMRYSKTTPPTYCHEWKKSRKQLFRHTRKKYLHSLLMLLCVTLLLATQSAYALDIIKTAKPQSAMDPREQYPLELLTTALSKTEESYGPFKITFSPNLSRDRALLELVEGKSFNVYTAPTKAEWEKMTLPIYFPIRKGLLGYRLFLITRNNLEKIAEIKNLEQLKALKVGLHAQWSTTKAMRPLGFNIITGNRYEGLFGMLNTHRFDYFPRGADEIFAEYETRRSQYPEMVIEPTKALYLAQPVYFFVSPKNPRLAKRIEEGLWQMLKDGSFDKLFYQHFQDAILQANLKNRVVFRVINPVLPRQQIYDRPELWFDPRL